MPIVRGSVCLHSREHTVTTMALMHGAVLGVFLSLASVVLQIAAQPSPQVQKRITAAIEAVAASNSTDIDYTQFVNVFIGTGMFILSGDREKE
jgi:hypothetical protein